MFTRILSILAVSVAAAALQTSFADDATSKPKELRAGIIGLDTSHAIAFTKLLNETAAKDRVEGCRVVAAYPNGSPDIESSTSRVPEYTKQVEGMGVEI